MSGVFGGTPVQAAGYISENLVLLENRVQTALLMQILNGADNNVQTLRNDEAPVLGLTVPIPTA